MLDFDVLMIGNFAKDKLIVDGVEEIASGGGVGILSSLHFFFDQ